MNKEFALQILDEVDGQSSRYIVEFGASITREAVGYLQRLNDRKKTPDVHLYERLARVREALAGLPKR